MNHGAAEVTYVKIGTEVLLDYDSKNVKIPGDDVSIGLVSKYGITIRLLETILASDLRWPYYSGLLNGAPINMHAILMDGSLDPPYEDITIKVSN